MIQFAYFRDTIDWAGFWLLPQFVPECLGWGCGWGTAHTLTPPQIPQESEDESWTWLPDSCGMFNM